nr:hypothetical protein [Sorangium cellulosum]
MHRVDEAKREPLPLDLDDWGERLVEQAVGDRHDPAGEVAVIELVEPPSDGDGRIAAHAPTLPEREGFAQASLGEGVDLALPRRVHEPRRAPHQTGVRGRVVVDVDEGLNTRGDVLQRGDRAQVIEHVFSKRPPESLHLAARLRVIGARMKQGDPEARAEDAQGVTTVGSAVVQIQRAGNAVEPERADEQPQHGVFLLVALDRDDQDEARSIVEQGVDSDGDPTPGEMECRAVTDVAVPERIGVVGLPLEPSRRPLAVALRDLVEPLLTEEATHGRCADRGAQASVGAERAQDERHRGIRVLPPDVTQELPQHGVELAAAPAVATGARAETFEPTPAIGIEPALEGRYREGARARAPGRTEALHREGA